MMWIIDFVVGILIGFVIGAQYTKNRILKEIRAKQVIKDKAGK